MKKILMILASFALLAGGLVGASQAAVSSSEDSVAAKRSTAAPRAINPRKDANVPAALKSGKRLTEQGLSDLGLKRLDGDELAQVEQAAEQAKAKSAQSSEMSSSTVGSYYYYTWQDGGHSWADRYYSYYVYSSDYYFLYFFDNYKICGPNYCQAANAYVYHYYLWYYGAWYGAYGEYGAYYG